MCLNNESCSDSYNKTDGEHCLRRFIWVLALPPVPVPIPKSLELEIGTETGIEIYPKLIGFGSYPELK